MDNTIQFSISEKPHWPGDTGPQIIIGFHNASFSQAVYLDVPKDPQDCVKVADAFYKGFIEACAVSTKEWELHNAQSAGAEIAAGSSEEASDGQA